MENKTDWIEVGSGGEIHDFKVTPELIGKFIKVETEQGPKKNSNLYTLETENGKEVKFWGGTVIDSRFEYIEPGEQVKIVYEGKQKSKTGTEYNSYRIFHKVTDEIPVVKSDEVNTEEIPF